MVNRPPNFIFIQGEDAGRYLGCYGDPCAHTPRVDQLAASGCRFDLAFSTAPVCAPSRGAMVTGRYAWSLGNHHMRSQLAETPRTFTGELREAGYYVAWSGKTDFNFTPQEGHHADALLRPHQEWVAALRAGELGKEQPFFCYMNFAVTHESTMWGPNLDRMGQNQQRVAYEHRIPPEHRVDPSEVTIPPYLPESIEVRTDIARFYQALAILDLQVGEILDALEASGQADNTYLIYLTDHGRGLPREKRWLYDAGLHQSLLMAGPGIEPGSVSNELVSWVDIAPTLLSLARCPVPSEYQGQCFLGQSKAAPRDYVFAGRDRMDGAFDRCRSVRNQRFHYIRNHFPQLPYAPYMNYAEAMATLQVLRERHRQGLLTPEQAAFLQPEKPPEEFYDAHADPHMVHNLANHPDHAATLNELREALEAHQSTVPDLGELSEQNLIDQGILIDNLDNYRVRNATIPESYAKVPHLRPILEMPGSSPHTTP